MKTIRTTRAIATLLALGTLSVGNINVWAAPITILDTGDEAYWGAVGNGDVIGTAATFGITQADVDYNHATGSLKVDILTPFANKVGALGAVFGDLFLNASWTPSGSIGDHWGSDNANSATRTEWGYALVMDDHDGNTSDSGVVTLYELLSGNASAFLSDYYFGTTNSTWREGQVVRVNTAEATDTGRKGTWTVPTSNILSFEVNLYNTDLWSAVNTKSELAIHWGMTCANDVVSGSIPVISLAPPSGVPEPGILALLCSGLGGLVWSRRRKLAK